MDDEQNINYGLHSDDTLNIPHDGQVKINIGHPPEDEEIYLLPSIAEIIKPHQIGGIRFLYDTIVETLNTFRDTKGSGCILAHSMGLGKTLQVISLVEILYRCVDVQTVVIVLPVCVINQWSEEFDRYIPPQHRKFNIYSQNSTFDDWMKTGGVLLIGYEILRNLLSTESLLRKHVQNPQLMVFDEGHRLKNLQSRTTQALSSIQCDRRIILTGYPLQNHLIEYWSMVNFVKPNYLLDMNNFVKIFKKPIEEGQYIDSTEDQINLMNSRCKMLHTLLEPIIQRRTSTVLMEQLPKKTEYVIFIKMSELQIQLYNHLMEKQSNMPLLTMAAFCRKILNHPDLLLRADIDDSEDIKETLNKDNDEYEKKVKKNWFMPHMTNYTKNLLQNSPKMEILISIISENSQTDDKMIVFSLSTTTLNLIEYYIQTKLNLIKQWNYLRIAGATTSIKRTAFLSEFNLNASIKLLLLSTKASSLGLNLVAANKVVIFEPSWNPCDDQQAYSRIFRFGQQKPTFVYRLIIDNSFELALLYRQTNKINMSDRIIDEIFPTNKFTLQKLKLFEKIEKENDEPINFSNYENYENVIRNVIKKQNDRLSKLPVVNTNTYFFY